MCVGLVQKQEGNLSGQKVPYSPHNIIENKNVNRNG
jgi:hypothetical protein